jgi:hypothetical protein
VYLDDVESLVHRGVGIEGKAGIHFSRNLARNDLKNFAAELDEKTVQGGIDLFINVLALLPQETLI